MGWPVYFGLLLLGDNNGTATGPTINTSLALSVVRASSSRTPIFVMVTTRRQSGVLPPVLDYRDASTSRGKGKETANSKLRRSKSEPSPTKNKRTAKRTPKDNDSPPQKKKRKANNGTAIDVTNVASKSKSHQPETVRKRRGQGKFARLKEFPLEILDYVLSYLPPDTLLSLTRSCRWFRDHLGDPRQAQSIWKSSFESLECPPLPRDLTYPQYAALLFDKNCAHCGFHGPIKRIMYCFRRRLCPRCLKTECIRHLKARRDYDLKSRDDENILKLIPYTELTEYRYGTKAYYAADLEWVFSQIDILKNQRGRGVAKGALEGFKSMRLQLMKEAEEHGAACTQWERETLPKKRREERYNIRKRRRCFALEKLKQRGWEESDLQEFSHQFRNKIFQPDHIELTDENWPWTRSIFEHWLTDIRAERFELEKKQHLVHRWSVFKTRYEEFIESYPALPSHLEDQDDTGNPYFPNMADVATHASFEPVRQWINSWDGVVVNGLQEWKGIDNDPDLRISRMRNKEFQENLNLIWESILTWRKNVLQELETRFETGFRSAINNGKLRKSQGDTSSIGERGDSSSNPPLGRRKAPNDDSKALPLSRRLKFIFHSSSLSSYRPLTYPALFKDRPQEWFQPDFPWLEAEDKNSYGRFPLAWKSTDYTIDFGGS